MEKYLREGVLGILDDFSFRNACEFYRYHNGETVVASPASRPAENAVRRYLLSFAQYLIADELRTRADTNTMLGMLLLGMHVWRFETNETELDEICAEKLEPNRKQSLSERLLHADIYHTEQIAGAVVANWFFQKDRGPMFILDGEEIKRILDVLGLSIEGEFEAGNAIEVHALLDLFDDATLEKWCSAWKVELPGTAGFKRPKLVELLAKAIEDGRPMPAELKTAWKAIGKK